MQADERKESPCVLLITAILVAFHESQDFSANTTSEDSETCRCLVATPQL